MIFISFYAERDFFLLRFYDTTNPALRSVERGAG